MSGKKQPLPLFFVFLVVLFFMIMLIAFYIVVGGLSKESSSKKEEPERIFNLRLSRILGESRSAEESYYRIRDRIYLAGDTLDRAEKGRLREELLSAQEDLRKAITKIAEVVAEFRKKFGESEYRFTKTASEAQNRLQKIVVEIRSLLGELE
jgi:hypothetical protein